MRKWKSFCEKFGLDHLNTDVTAVLDFLSKLYYNDNAGYNVLNCARSALSSFLVLLDTPHSVGTHPLIKRFMRGVFQLRPPTARYKEIWDVSSVFNYLRSLSPASSLTLKMLTLKLCMIIALTSAQRVQTLHFMHLDKMSLSNSAVTFHFEELLKQSKPGNLDTSVTLDAYPPDRRLCVVRYLKYYIKRTKLIREAERRLFISYKKPHKRVSSQTISRWLKYVMSSAGIDTAKYKAHSTRAASTSAANNSDLPVSAILSQAGWSNEKTFRNFYNKPVDGGRTFSQAILSQ